MQKTRLSLLSNSYHDDTSEKAASAGRTVPKITSTWVGKELIRDSRGVCVRCEVWMRYLHGSVSRVVRDVWRWTVLCAWKMGAIPEPVAMTRSEGSRKGLSWILVSQDLGQW